MQDGRLKSALVKLRDEGFVADASSAASAAAAALEEI